MFDSHDARRAPVPSSPVTHPVTSEVDDAAPSRPVIKVTGVVLRRAADGHALTVRKRGTGMFMFPGGKPEADETPREAGIREVREELGLELPPEDLVLVGEWHTDAANEPGHALHSHVFLSTVPLTETPIPAAEIEELRWQPLDGVDGVEDLAPLSRWYALPVVRSAGSWPRR
ncbi:NUDIX hydrolase [Kocuria varians]|uniref:NUDIX hydrolase n=1 Tax=Kocuria varians TaxID=1272 RepID=UPI0009EE65C7|nr:NUDIX domain-containing protein [Kocuria varians]